jgi:hypothetical protein
VFHRDIKPDNIFVLDGRIVVGDWGLVRRPDVELNTPADARLGPAFFIAPEMLNKAANEEGDKADVYALAKTMWCLLTNYNYPMPGQHDVSTSVHNLDTYVVNGKNAQVNKALTLATKQDKVSRISMKEFNAELASILAPVKLSVNVQINPEEFSRRIAAAIWQADQAGEIQKRRMDEIDVLADQVKVQLAELAAQYKSLGNVHAGLSTNVGIIVENPGYSGIQKYHGWAISLYPKTSNIHVRLSSGIAIAAMQSGRTALIARHVLSVDGRHESLWESTGELAHGSSQLSQKLSELKDKLYDSSSAAVDRFVGAL